MKKKIFIWNILFLLLYLNSGCSSNKEEGKILGAFTVEAGDYDRFETPVRYECKLADIMGDDQGSSSLTGSHLVLRGSGFGSAEIPVQWEPKVCFSWEKAGGEGSLFWVLDGKMEKGTKRTYKLLQKKGEPKSNPFTFENVDNKSILVKNGDRPVMQYNYGIMREKEGQDGIFDKSSYIHPVWSPKGEIITGDFSPEHVWQRGIYLAWQKVKFGDIETNFWELGKATGRTLKDDKDPEQIKGPVFSELIVHNKGTVEGRTFFREKCIVRLYNRPEQDNWMFDISFRQWPVDPENPGNLPGVAKVMELQQVYYGGMSFRGVSPGWLHYDFIAKNKEQLSKFDKATKWLDPADSLDILTSEGFARKNGNATPARWIDYTGPLGEGWGGLVMFDNPSNKRYPTPLRIHPDMPYFCFAFAKDSSYTVTSKASLDLNYRVVVHNGHPDKEANEVYARDFTDAPNISWKKTE